MDKKLVKEIFLALVKNGTCTPAFFQENSIRAQVRKAINIAKLYKDELEENE